MKALLRKLILLFIIFPFLVYSQEITELNLSLKEKNLPFGLTKFVPMDKPEVSLVLSGGGSRAISHIGVLKAIEELEIPIDQIVGTSMGSVIGGLYSAGYTIDEIDSIVVSTNWEELFSLTDQDRKNLFVDQKITEDKSLLTLRLNGFKPSIPNSINTGKKISNLLTSLTLSAPINQYDSFDNLLFKYRAVCTDLVSGKRTVLKDGLLSEAMRASSSVSFVLPPVKRDTLILVDGGLVDNLPIKSAEELKPDFIIASDATSALRKKNELNFPWEIADQLVTIPSRIIWEENISKADVLIRQNFNKRKNDDFENLDEIIKAGYDSAKYILLTTKNKIQNIFKERLSKNNKFYKNLSVPTNSNLLEKEILKSFNGADSVSKAEILNALYSFYQSGIYENLSAIIISDSSSVLKINYETNPLINNIEFNGITQIPIDTAIAQFNNVLNKPYSADEAFKSILKLIKKYRENGLVLATVDRIFFSKALEKLIISVNEGLITEVEVKGNKTTLNNVITREFATDAGDYLFKNNLDEGLANIASTDLFDNVKLSFSKNGDGKKIRIDLDEKLPNVLRFGLRIDNENFTQFAVDLRNENLFGTGSELGFSVSGGIRNLSYVIEHKTNRIFNTYLTYKAQAFYHSNDVNVYGDDIINNIRKFSRSKIAEYKQILYGGFIGVGAHLKKLGTLTAEGKYEIDEIKNISSLQEEQSYKLNISSLRLRLQIDSQNKYPYPTKGIYINTFYETAQKILGGDISFAKFSFDYSSYFTFANLHTLTPHIIFGFADETLPLSQQFNFGGQYNFLGYRDYEFRGRQIFISSLQYRYKVPFDLYFDTYFKIRYDLGSSWLNQQEIRFNDLRHGIGLTISLDTPIGPADFSVGRSSYLKDSAPERIISRGPLFFYFTMGYYY
ncbi:MAG: BamA/TamA family outer membrane protein [Ignavibacteriae bacterium]|nr:BamA/TamA family outer membrane protein [Ignavibacteriota bacterium]